MSFGKQLRGPGEGTVCSGSAVFRFGKQNSLGISALLVLVQLGLQPNLEGTTFPAAQMLSCRGELLASPGLG